MFRFAQCVGTKRLMPKHRRIFSTNSTGTVARVLDRYARLCERHPWSSAFIVCFIKGSLSDMFSQRLVEGKNSEQHSWKRTLVFALFGGWYCGWAQHLLYNRLYPALLGAG